MALLHDGSAIKLKLAERSYAEAFRFFGHELSELEVNHLEIRNTGNAFQVLAKHAIKHSSRPERQRTNLKRRLSKLLFRRDKAKASTRSGTFNRRYTAEEIQRSNSELKMKRQGQRSLGNARRDTDGYGLSELLRTIGAILDADGARFESLIKDNESITVGFCDRNGKQVTKSYSISAIRAKQRDFFFSRNKSARDPWGNLK